MASASTTLATVDRRPFFEKALHYGLERQIISPARLELIQEDLARGIVQIANYFGTAHLRPELELALHRMANLISLYLEDLSDGDLQIAACSLRDKTLLSHSKGGSDMIKRLHALPEDTVIIDDFVSPESQRAELDERTSADTIALDKFRAELAVRQDIQATLEFSFWLARRMGVPRAEIEDADSLIRSAMLVVFVARAELSMPSRTAFVRLFKAARGAKAALDPSRFDAFFKDAPDDFRRLAQRAMQRFIENDLPQIRAPGSTADQLLYGDCAQSYFIRQSLDDDVREYDRLVAREWDRVTRGEADDPAVVATVFLFLATGMPPKAAMLLKDAREVIRVFRTSGFDAQAVTGFIASHAPQAIRGDLLKSWTDDLMPEAEERLADTDPNWPDTHMERALDYLRTTCRVTWKGRRR